MASGNVRQGSGLLCYCYPQATAEEIAEEAAIEQAEYLAQAEIEPPEVGWLVRTNVESIARDLQGLVAEGGTSWWRAVESLSAWIERHGVPEKQAWQRAKALLHRRNW